MPQISPFLAFSLLFTPLLISTQTTTKFDFLLYQVLEPYEYHLLSFTSQASDLFESFQFLLPFALSQEEGIFPGDSILRSSKRQKDKKGNYYHGKDNGKSHIEKANEERMLQWDFWRRQGNDCFNNGYLINTTATSYHCDGNLVTKQTYMDREGENCTIETQEKEVCVCTLNYYGNMCQVPNVFRCTVESLTFPTDKCTIKSSYEDNRQYSYSIAGNDAPCHSVERDATIEMKYKMSCRYDRPDFTFKGIKVLDSFEYKQPEVHFENSKPEENGLESSYSKQIKMKLKFINWKKLYSPLIFETTVDERHIFGNETFGFNITVDSSFLSHSSGGRFYYVLEPEEIGLMNVNKISGVLEDANFVGSIRTPPKKRLFNIVFYVMIIILVLLVILHKRKDWIKSVKRAEIMDESRQDPEPLSSTNHTSFCKVHFELSGDFKAI